jgi:hypothetical protein
MPIFLLLTIACLSSGMSDKPLCAVFLAVPLWHSRRETADTDNASSEMGRAREKPAAKRRHA